MTTHSEGWIIEERIIEILKPAIDPNAPYAKQMIAALVKLVEEGRGPVGADGDFVVTAVATPEQTTFKINGTDIKGELTVPKVLNMYAIGNKISEGQVYVGRPSKWGNPFEIGKDGTRAEVIMRYLMWVVKQKELMRDLHELRGKDLVCWCKPSACHGDILIKLANKEK